MSKGLKTFRVQKRFEVWLETNVRAPDLEFEVWLETTVRAPDFDSATKVGRAMTMQDFLTVPEQTEVNDTAELPGFQVGEEWQ